MLSNYIIALLATGAGVGFASGLLGVGGCFIMIPVQYWIYTAIGVPADVAIKVAFGTNLLVVLPTAASGAWGHSRGKSGVVEGRYCSGHLWNDWLVWRSHDRLASPRLSTKDYVRGYHPRWRDKNAHDTATQS